MDMAVRQLSTAQARCLSVLATFDPSWVTPGAAGLPHQGMALVRLWERGLIEEWIDDRDQTLYRVTARGRLIAAAQSPAGETT